MNTDSYPTLDERECTCASNRRSRECEMHGDQRRDSRRGTVSHRDIVDAQRRSFGEDGSDAAEGRAALDALTPCEAAAGDRPDTIDRDECTESRQELKALHHGARLRYRKAEAEATMFRDALVARDVELLGIIKGLRDEVRSRENDAHDWMDRAVRAEAALESRQSAFGTWERWERVARPVIDEACALRDGIALHGKLDVAHRNVYEAVDTYREAMSDDE